MTRRFYHILENEDGTVDVYLNPEIYTIKTEDGIADRDISFRVVHGVTPYEGLEDDIRARYTAWCESGEKVWM